MGEIIKTVKVPIAGKGAMTMTILKYDKKFGKVRIPKNKK